MKKLIHFGPPLENHSHNVSIETTGSLLNAIILSAQLAFAAALLPLSWLLKTQICIGVKPMPTLGERFLRSKDKKKFAKDFNENLLKEMGLNPKRRIGEYSRFGTFYCDDDLRRMRKHPLSKSRLSERAEDRRKP